MKNNENQKGRLPNHSDLVELNTKSYIPSGLHLSGYKQESENRAYGAAYFQLNQKRIQFRVGKITPIKIGQFIAFYKRQQNGVVSPYDMTDPFDFLIVSARSLNYFGQYIFPKAVLVERGVVSENRLRGKMAFRLYPPWDIPQNPQAKRSQEWQLPYFLNMPSKGGIDCQRIKEWILNHR